MHRPSTIKPLAMIIHTLVLATGLTILYFAYLQNAKVSYLLTHGSITTATVIANINDDDESNMYRPKFEFLDKQNKKIQFEGAVSSSTPAWSVGETTSVVYNAENPEEARIISYWNLYRLVIILTSIAAPFTIIGLGYFLFLLRLQDVG